MTTGRRRHALVIANGELPPRRMLLPLVKEASFILCADGGANKARAYALRPDCIIGDLDSITAATRRYYASVPVIRRADQYSTDLEKALDFLLQSRFPSAVVVGATGARSDHELANYSILLKYHRKLSLRYFDALSTIEVVEGSVRFASVPGQQISIMPMGVCRGIVTTGLKYPLRNESLALGVREGSSNEATGRSVRIAVKHGSLLLFKIHPSVRS